ncbi:unnamed protein product [Phytomonas sp. Hart1]|nr:unnamed protein product [Phytomonas sp. Hart1]|eukprot:CCW69177.1 unnamed protein product [Phytomonas sp. isolate Hart1]
MRTSIIYAQVFLLLSYLTLANAVKVDVKETAAIEIGFNLSKPNSAIQFSDTTFCFRTIGSTLEAPFPSEQLLCSFNKGSSFVTVNSDLSFCGSRGIVLNGQLYCPHKKVIGKDSSFLGYSTIVFTPKNEIIESKISSQEVSFQMKPNIVPNEIKFNGGVQYISSEGYYLMAATVIDVSNLESPYLFKSVNGFNWTMIDLLPLNQPDEMYLQCDSKITIVAKNNSNYYKVISEDMGQSWSGVKYLNTVSPPFSIMLPSNVVMQYALSNHTLGEVTFLSPLPPKNVSNSFLRLNNLNQSLDKINNTEKDIVTSYYAVSMQVSSAPLQFIMIHDEVIQDKFLLRTTLIEIDDSEEKQYLDEQNIEAAKKREKEKLLKEKARQENLRTKWRIQNKIRKADEERHRKFADFDRLYIKRALENMKHDNEFIVVRQVKPEFIDFESEAL